MTDKVASTDSSSDKPHTANTPHAHATQRKLVNALIVALVLLQLALPLRYYLGFAGGDDERFSWRMFSTVRLQRCEVNVTETTGDNDTPQQVRLRPILQVAWISILERFRPSVVEGFLRFRCQTEGVTKVLYTRRCVAPDGTSNPPDHLAIECDSGVISEGQAQ